MRIVSLQTRRASIWRAEMDPDAVAAVNFDHRTILAAVLERDVEATRSALHLHLRDAERWLRLAMQHSAGRPTGEQPRLDSPGRDVIFDADAQVVARPDLAAVFAVGSPERPGHSNLDRLPEYELVVETESRIREFDSGRACR